MKCIQGFLAAVVLIVIAGVIVMYSGVINIAATNPHHPITAYVLGTTMDNSVRAHARGITVPPLDDKRTLMDGFRHYREMCVGCHLAPGVKSSEIRKGLMPEPPKLQEVVEEWKPNELFWVIKNGVKMTGMPAWGPTHSDEKIWAMVAFLEKLPHMTVAQYKEMDKMAGPDEEHHHDDGDEEHDHGDPDAGMDDHDDTGHSHGDDEDHQH